MLRFSLGFLAAVLLFVGAVIYDAHADQQCKSLPIPDSYVNVQIPEGRYAQMEIFVGPNRVDWANILVIDREIWVATPESDAVIGTLAGDQILLKSKYTGEEIYPHIYLDCSGQVWAEKPLPRPDAEPAPPVPQPGQQA